MRPVRLAEFSPTCQYLIVETGEYYRAVQLLAFDAGFRWNGNNRHGVYAMSSVRRLLLCKQWQHPLYPPTVYNAMYTAAGEWSFDEGQGRDYFVMPAPLNLNNLVTWLHTPFEE